MFTFRTPVVDLEEEDLAAEVEDGEAGPVGRPLVVPDGERQDRRRARRRRGFVAVIETE
jgi:hypothetical protein